MTLSLNSQFSKFKKELSKVQNDLKTSCVICLGCLSLCSKCEIKKLKNQVSELTEVVNFLCNESSSVLNLSKVEINLIDIIFERYSYPADEPQIDEREFIFITLTFDPEKFGQNNQPEDEKSYLLSVISKLVKTNNLQEIYGSFEYQKNGAIHCHFISKFSDYSYIKKQLKVAMTNRPRNEKAIDIKSVKGITKLWNYINKDPSEKEWFVTRNSYYPQRLDYDLDYGLSSPEFLSAK